MFTGDEERMTAVRQPEQTKGVNQKLSEAKTVAKFVQAKGCKCHYDIQHSPIQNYMHKRTTIATTVSGVKNTELTERTPVLQETFSVCPESNWQLLLPAFWLFEQDQRILYRTVRAEYVELRRQCEHEFCPVHW